MGGAVSSLGLCFASCLGWCACSSAMSLCNACCDTDSKQSTGRKRSVLLLGLSVLFAFLFQYSLAPALAPDSTNWIVDIPELGSYLVESWNSGCNEDKKSLQNDCRGNTGVYRVTLFAGLFFSLLALVAMGNPSFNRKSWPSKYILYSCLVFASIFVPNQPLFLDIYVPIARVGSSIFIILQQIVLIDLAYSWNESWVEKSNDADYKEFGSGQKWLRAILISCGILYLTSLTGIILLWKNFSGCHENEAFIVITGVMILVTTVIQLLSEQASLLTSAVIATYSTSLCFSAVSKNADETCNPRLGEDDPLGIFIGVSLTCFFLVWVGFSATANGQLGSDEIEDEPSQLNDDISGFQMEKPLITGVFTNGETDSEASGSIFTSKSSIGSQLWKLNAMLALVTCWMATSFTEWGTVAGDGDIANPESGDINMWMIIISQWITFGLYSWTLAAPLLFPDRDFS